MKAIPEISTSSTHIVVEDLHYRGPWFGLVGAPSWRVRWRCVDDPALQGVSLLRPGQTAGSAELAGESFCFVVRWRAELRRPIGRRSWERYREQLFVTPAAVMRLAGYLSRAPRTDPAAERERS